MPATSVVVASMIGSGIFMTTGKVGPLLVSPGNVLAAWLFAGLFALGGAICLAELGAMLPRSGGSYIFAKRAYGARIGCFVGYEAMLIAFPATIAVISVVMAEYLAALLPGGSVRLVAVLGLLVVTAIHCRGTSFGAKINSIGALLKLTLLICFVVFGFYCAISVPAVSALALSLPNTPPPTAPGIWSSEFASAVIIVSFSYVGWNNVTMLGGEIKRPERNIPFSILGGVTVVTILYLLINLVFMRAVHPTAMVDSSGEPTSTIGYMVAEHLFPGWVADLLGWGILFLIISTLISVVLAGGRMAYAMALSGQMPARLGRLNQDGSPVAALLLQAAITVVLIAMFDVRQMLLFSGLSGMLSSVLVIGAVIVLRIRKPHLVRPFRLPLFPLPAVITLVLALWLMWQTAIGNPTELKASAVVVGGLALLAAVRK